MSKSVFVIQLILYHISVAGMRRTKQKSVEDELPAVSRGTVNTINTQRWNKLNALDVSYTSHDSEVFYLEYSLIFKIKCSLLTYQ